MTKPIRVEIKCNQFVKLDAVQNGVITSIDLTKRLASAGIPVDAAIGLRGVKHGRLSMWTEGENYIYEWTPGATQPQSIDEDDEL